MTGAWVSELSSPLGSKSDPSAGHVSWISIYFLIGVPEVGYVFGFIFWFHRRAWFWIWVCSKKQDFFKKCAFSFEKMVDYARPGDQKLSSSGGLIWVTFRMSVLNPARGYSIGFGRGAVFGPRCRVRNQNKIPSRIVRDKKNVKKMKCQGGPNLVPQGAPFSNLSQFFMQNAFAKPPQLHQDNWNISSRKASQKNKYQSRHTSDPQNEEHKETQRSQKRHWNTNF